MILFLLLPNYTFSQQDTCPDDRATAKPGIEYRDSYYEGKLKCLYFISEQLAWNDASEYCYQNIKVVDQEHPTNYKYSGELASIHTTAEDKFIFSQGHKAGVANI